MPSGHGWIWLEAAPDAELPDLTTILLRNELPTQSQGEIDSTLVCKHDHDSHEHTSVHSKMATVNVGTMDYHNEVGYGMSWKGLELAKQFGKHNLHLLEYKNAELECPNVSPQDHMFG